MLILAGSALDTISIDRSRENLTEPETFAKLLSVRLFYFTFMK